MYWSAAVQLRAPPSNSLAQQKRASYGSFARSGSSGSLHIPPSIPEHQSVSQFASPRFRLAPPALPTQSHALNPAEDDASTRQVLTTKLLLLNAQRARKTTPLPAAPTVSAVRAKALPPQRPPLVPRPDESSRLLGVSDLPNPQEHELEAEEHNYWTRERERRRLGLQKSRRRTCTPLTERATTSALKVGVIMCSVPLVLVLAFVLFVIVLGRGASSAGSNSVVDFLWGSRAEEAVTALWTSVAGHWNASQAGAAGAWALRGSG